MQTDNSDRVKKKWKSLEIFTNSGLQLRVRNKNLIFLFLNQNICCGTWAPKTHVKTDGQENIYIFTLKIFVYLNLCLLSKFFPSLI